MNSTRNSPLKVDEMKHRIEWCIWQSGVDEADQHWTVAVPNAGVDLSDRASCEAECAALDYDGEGRYTHRVVELGSDIDTDEPVMAEPRKTMVQRYDARTGKWFDVELEIAS